MVLSYSRSAYIRDMAGIMEGIRDPPPILTRGRYHEEQQTIT